MITTGKWEYSSDVGSVESQLADGSFVQIAHVVDGGDADGMLMAASKDLLAACEKAIGDGKQWGGELTWSAWEAIRKAVRKAKP